MQFLRNCWMPLALSREVREKPLAIRILDTRVVVFRASDGTVAVLEDRCAHRGVALSEGHIIDDCIMCPYHGWRFDTAGRCVRVPSLLREETVPDFRVPAFASVEGEGIVWVALDAPLWQPAPPRWRHPGARSVLTMLEIVGNYVHLMENLVDNPHAGFIHSGLIRNEPTQHVTAEITETPLHVTIRTRGEKTNDSLLFRLLARRGEEVAHVEEYLAPNEMVSTYSQRGHVAGVQSFIVPIDEHHTRWFFRTFLDFGPFGALVFPIYRRVVRRILEQDAEVVRKVDEQARTWPGRRTCSTRSDTPSVVVARAARSFATAGMREGGEQVRNVEYLL